MFINVIILKKYDKLEILNKLKERGIFMSGNNSYIPIPPVPANDYNKEADKEIILEENISEDLMKRLNSENFNIILPEETKVKDKK